MTKSKTLLGALILSATIIMSSCVKDATEQIAVDNGKTASKLVFTSDNAVGGELLVYFDEGAATKVESGVSRSGATRSGIDDFDAVLENIGVKSMQRLFPVDVRNEERTRAAGLHRWYIVRFDENADLDEAAHAMAKVAEVERIEFNQQLTHVHSGKITPITESETAATAQTRAAAQFNDPYLSRQWHYINTGDKSIYSGIKAGADVNCGEAWRLCTGDPRVIVAVVDNCVQWDHPDLAANMWVNERENTGSAGNDDDGNGYKDDVHGYNFVSDCPLTISTTGRAPEHGTHVAGTVAAVNNNGKGVCGIAGGSGNNDGVRIMSCQIFHDAEGGSAAISAKAIKYAADNGAAIIQCSYGYDAGTVTSDTQYAAGASVEKQAIDYFISSKNCEAVDGGIVIFAAGNDSAAMSGYPGAYRDYISVTAMSCDFSPAPYTNYGPGCNIAAPGGDYYQNYSGVAQVLSTVNNGGYGYSQGTSMACPHVSGVAALGISYALQIGKKLTRDEFNTILLTSVNDINRYCADTRYSGKMGTGYIDAFQVLMNIRGITCIPVETGSQQTIDIQQYLGSGDLGLNVSAVEMSDEDMTRLGMTSRPTVFSKKILIRCNNTGSAIIKVRLVAGSSNTSGMNGMTITKEFALIARENHSANGGWL